MYKFSEVDYDADAGTATIGAGLIWDDVYAALAPYNVNVVGGRVTGVGVAGFSLGGGKCHAACGAGIRALCRRRGAEVAHSCAVVRLLVEDEPTRADNRHDRGV